MRSDCSWGRILGLLSDVGTDREQQRVEQRRSSLRNLIALVVGAGVPYAYLLWTGGVYEGEWAPENDSVGDLIYDGLSGVLLGCGWLYLFLRYVSREPLSALNLRQGNYLLDLRHGVLLLFAVYAAGVAAQYLFYWLNFSYWESPARDDMARAARSGWPMVWASIFFDWTAAASFEEMLRAFFISRFSKLNRSPLVKTLAVYLSALFFGLYHLYYGPHGSFVLMVEGLVLGTYYVRYGRLLPLIIAHGLFNMSFTFMDILYGPPV